MKTLAIALGLLLGGAASTSAAPASVDAGLEIQSLCFDTKAEPAKVREAALKRGFVETTSGGLEIAAPYAATLTLGREHMDKTKSKMLGDIDLQSCRLVFHGSPGPSQDTLRRWFKWGKAELPWSGYVSTSHGKTDISEVRSFSAEPSLAAGAVMGDTMRRGALGMLIARTNDRGELDLYFGQVSPAK